MGGGAGDCVVAYVEGAMALCAYTASVQDHMMQAGEEPAEQARLNMLLELLIPVTKSWPSEWCLEANKWAIQTLGGYGYTADYSPEQTYRDNRINMIYEGTNGIHSIDLMGRKISMGGGAAYRAFGEEVQRTVAMAKRAQKTAGVGGAGMTAQATSQTITECTAVLEDAMDLHATVTQHLLGIRDTGNTDRCVHVCNARPPPALLQQTPCCGPLAVEISQ